MLCNIQVLQKVLTTEDLPSDDLNLNIGTSLSWWILARYAVLYFAKIQSKSAPLRRQRFVSCSCDKHCPNLWPKSPNAVHKVPSSLGPQLAILSLLPCLVAEAETTKLKTECKGCKGAGEELVPESTCLPQSSSLETYKDDSDLEWASKFPIFYQPNFIMNSVVSASTHVHCASTRIFHQGQNTSWQSQVAWKQNILS